MPDFRDGDRRQDYDQDPRRDPRRDPGHDRSDEPRTDDPWAADQIRESRARQYGERERDLGRNPGEAPASYVQRPGRGFDRDDAGPQRHDDWGRGFGGEAARGRDDWQRSPPRDEPLWGRHAPRGPERGPERGPDHGPWGRPQETRSFDRDDSPARGGYGAYAHEGERGGGRSWIDKAQDEIAGWFGGAEAQRRRRWDEVRGDPADRYRRGEGEHRGRGPKGYQRADDRIRDDVHDRLTEDSWVDASDIEVQVSNGEVTLNGLVASREEKRRAEDLVDSVAGVGHVQNNLRVRDGRAQAQARSAVPARTVTDVDADPDPGTRV